MSTIGSLQSSKCYYVDIMNKECISINITEFGNGNIIPAPILVFQYNNADIKFDDNIYYIKFMYIGKTYYIKFIHESDDSIMALFVNETKDVELSDKFMIQNNILRSAIRICSSMFDTFDDLETRAVSYSLCHDDDNRSETSTNASQKTSQLLKALNIQPSGTLKSDLLNNDLCDNDLFDNESPESDLPRSESKSNNNNNELNSRLAKLRETKPSYVNVAAASADKVPEEKVVSQQATSVNDEHREFIINYRRLKHIFISFVEKIPTSKFWCHDFKIHLRKNSASNEETLNLFMDILEHNMEMIEKISSIKKIYPKGDIQMTFYEWVLEYITKEYPQLGAIFGRYNEKYSERQFIVYKLDSDKMYKYPSMWRDDEFFNIEMNRTIDVVLDIVNELKDGFEPFELGSVRELKTVIDLFYRHETKNAILEGLDEEIKNMVYIDFNCKYPSTPLVTYQRKYLDYASDNNNTDNKEVY